MGSPWGGWGGGGGGGWGVGGRCIQDKMSKARDVIVPVWGEMPLTTLLRHGDFSQISKHLELLCRFALQTPTPVVLVRCKVAWK